MLLGVFLNKASDRLTEISVLLQDSRAAGSFLNMREKTEDVLFF